MNEKPLLGQLERVTLREQALQQLRQGIFSGQIGAGSHLNEVELSKQFGISRGTIREALRALEQEGLIAKGSRGRLLVKVPTVQGIRDLYETRAALEKQAAGRLIHHPDRDAIVAELRDALDAMEREDEVLDRMEKDLIFHRILIEAAGNALLTELWVSLQNKAMVIAAHCAVDGIPSVMTRHFHLPLVDAILDGEESRLNEELDGHMGAAADLWSSQLTKRNSA